MRDTADSVRTRVLDMLGDEWLEGDEIARALGKRLASMQGTLTGMVQRHEIETRLGREGPSGRQLMMYRQLSGMRPREVYMGPWVSQAVVAEALDGLDIPARRWV